MDYNNVDFPEPTFPKITSISPDFISNDIFSKE